MLLKLYEIPGNLTFPDIMLSVIISVIILNIVYYRNKYISLSNELSSDQWAFLSLLSFTDNYFTLMLLQNWDSWTGLYQMLFTTYKATKLEGIEPWVHIPQFTNVPHDIWFLQMLETSKPNWQGREVADIEVDSFHPRCQIKTTFF